MKGKELVQSNLDLIQENKRLRATLVRVTRERDALRAAVDTSRAQRNGRYAAYEARRQRGKARGERLFRWVQQFGGISMIIAVIILTAVMI